jgi:hypothetical protein
MQDVRDAFRALKSTPVVTLVAILSLALGIGANTAIFSILDSLMLRSLPVRDPQRLAIVGEGNQQRTSWTNPIWEQLRGPRERPSRRLRQGFGEPRRSSKSGGGGCGAEPHVKVES